LEAAAVTLQEFLASEVDAGLVVGVALEGAADFFFGRPLDENPYARDWSGAWWAWRCGWLEASWFNSMRGEKERARWAA
jgi:hypothetical protein